MAMEIFRLIGSVFVDTDKADKSLKKTDKNAAGLGSKLLSVGKSAGKFAAGVATAAVAAGTALIAVAETTREYRTEQGKLQAAFDSANFSAEAANKTYKTLIGVIGETDQTVEAAQQIAMLAASEEDAAKWAGYAAGVVGKFGDALQPETFFEAANETIKLGEATGAYTQMLEGTGANVEDFNAELAAAVGYEEKQAVMLKWTEEALGSAADAYRDANGAVIDANVAQDNLNNAMAGIGAAVEPFLTMGKQLLADVLEKLTPILTTLAAVVIPWLSTALTTISETVLPIFTEAIDWIVANVLPPLTEALSAVGGWFDSIKTKLDESGVTFETVMTAVQTFFSGAMTAISDIWTLVGQPIWDLIKQNVGLVYGLFEENMPAIQEFVSTAFTDIQNIWEQNLKPALEAIGKFIKNVLMPAFKFVFETIITPIVKATFGGIVDLWNKTLKPGLQSILDFVTDVFSGDFSGAFENLVELIGSIWEGLVSVVKAPINAVIGLINSLIEGINDIKAPDFVPAIGGKSFNVKKIPTLETGGVLERGQTGFLEGNGAEAVVPLHQNKAWISRVAEDMDTAIGGASSGQVTGLLAEILNTLAEILNTLAEIAKAGIYLDSDKLVGGIARKMDKHLGQLQVQKARA